MAIQKITPFLWFDTQAEEAANYYTSLFPNSKVVKVVRNGDTRPGPADSAMTVEFQLDGLHPYREEDVAASWARIPGTSSVLIAITPWYVYGAV